MAFGRRKVQIAVGTATASDVLSGFTFSSAGAGVNADGAMTNEGSPTLQPGASITAGYYSGGQAAAPGSGSVSFTTPGSFSWTVPSGVTRIWVAIVGGGGGGGGGYSSTYTGGGGGGSPQAWVLAQVNPFDTIPIVIGQGGAGGAVGAAGSAGGASSITIGGVQLSVPGGSGGNPGTSTANGAAGSNVNLNPNTSNPPFSTYAYGNGPGGFAGASTKGGSGAPVGIWNDLINPNTTGGDFTMLIGNSGGAGGNSSTQPAAGSGGSGGGGGYINQAGANGGPGVVRIWW